MMQMEPGQCQQELMRLLDQSIECASRLHNLLGEEREALASQQSDKLLTIAASKELCVQCIENLEAERNTLCTACGFDFSEEGMQNLISWCGNASELRSTWNMLIDCARKCDALNQTNGAIGRLRYEQVTQALNILSGGDGDAELYSAQGQQPVRSGRELAQI